MNLRFNAPILLATLLISACSFAQTTTPATAPTTGPATTQRAAWKVTIPQGFVRVQAGDRMAICEAADEPWVKEVLTTAPPTTKPTTMPADLIDRFAKHREALVNQVTSDFGYSDKTELNKYIDEKLLPELKSLSEFHAPIYLMPITHAKLKELVKGGWGAPKFYYNRVADDIAYQPSINLTTENPDDHVAPIIYFQADSVDAKKKQLTDQVKDMEQSLWPRIAIQGQAVLQQGLIHFIDSKILLPLEFKPGQEWFGIGLEGVYSGRYVAMVNDISPDVILKFMSTDDPNNPIHGRTIDLLHLTPGSQLKPQFAAAYYDALRRRSVGVVNDWLAKVPPDSTPKILATIKESKPADGDALVKLIKDVSGVDLSEAVKPK